MLHLQTTFAIIRYMKSKKFERWVRGVGTTAAARKVSSPKRPISRQVVEAWVKNGIPPKHVLRVSEVTRIDCHQLRPDIYPQRLIELADE